MLMQLLHEAVYRGPPDRPRRLPDQYGLRDIWEEATLNETVVYAIPVGGA